MTWLQKRLFGAFVSAMALFMWGAIAQAAPILIDTTPPAFDDPASPWHSLAGEATITYAFKTSWDGITWTEGQKAVAYDAIGKLDGNLPDQTFVESGDFTLRWAGTDLFTDWRDGGDYSDPGWDLTGSLAIAYKHNNAPWDHGDYPNNEIYFNSEIPWSFDLLSVDSNGYDFWTVMLHEVIHMLASDAHATDSDEVMYPYVSKGERKGLKESDAEILRNAGYNVPPLPEPATIAIICFGLASLSVARRRRTA